MDPADHLPPEDIELILRRMDLKTMLNIARTNQRYAAMLRDDSFWARMMRDTYPEVVNWCHGHLPIFYQANELLSDVLDNIRDHDMEWQTDFDDADIAMPWKRFYLHTRRMYRRFISTEEHAQEAKRRLYNSFIMSFVPLLITRDALFQNAAGRHPLPFSPEDAPIETFFFNDIQPVPNGVAYDGVVRTDIELSDPNQRAELVQLLHAEPTLVRSIVFGNKDDTPTNDQTRMRLMAMYDMYADILTAPVSLFRIYDHRVLRLMRQDNSRLIRVLGLTTLDAKNDPVTSLYEYAERLVSAFFYDCTDMRDFMLWSGGGYNMFYDFMTRANSRPMDGLREHATFLVRLMLEKSVAPRSHREKRPLLLCVVCGPVESLKWMHAGGAHLGAYCSDACVNKAH